MSYEGRPKELNLFSRSKRRMRADLIEVFQIFKGLDINAEDYFTIDQSNITRRRNSFKRLSTIFLTNETKHFFWNGVVNIWNSLPSNVVDSITLTPFNNRLHDYFHSNPQLKYYLID